MIVQRDRLNEKLNRIFDIKLTLVVAPAGYGKTTAVCSWLDDMQRLGDYVWLTLSEGENEPTKFWTYFFMAIEKVHSGLASNLLSLLLLNNYWSVNDVLVLFINQTVDFALEFLVILDDFHHIKNQEIQQQFNFLIAHLSKNIHIVVMSRIIPEFYTPRINLSCESMLVQTEDLNFSEQEIAIFFRQYLGVDLSRRDISKISARTQGWIAIMALMAEKIRENKVGLISLSDEKRVLFEYFEKEIMNELSDDAKDFLVKTAVFDTFSNPMCKDLLEIANIKDVFQMISKYQLLSYYYENRKSGYRYCPIFSEFLNEQFDEQYPNSRNLLYMKTSIWFENKGKVHDC
jgi:LuxR family maltose regulon positive regulatory protein